MKKLAWLLLLVSGVAAAAPPTATLNWSAVTKYTDGTNITTPVTYTVYQGVSGGTKTVLQSGLSVLTLTITSGLPANSTVCWELTTSAGGQESVRSNEACKTFPPQIPEATTLTVE